MILIVTSTDDLTADYLILRLIEREIPFFRLNTEDVPFKLQETVTLPAQTFLIKNELGVSVNEKQVTSIWYRRPKLSRSLPDDIDLQILPYIQEDSWFLTHGLFELTNESTVWISRPENIRRAENKIYQLKVADTCGLKIPLTFIGNSPEELEKLMAKEQKHGFIVKPIRSGRYFLQNETLIFYTTNFPDEWKWSEIERWPVIVQERIRKKRDIRVTFFGDKIYAVAINSAHLAEKVQLDWRRSMDEVSYESVILPGQIEGLLSKMLNCMGLLFGAFDLVETPEGEYVFLELNPNGQWAWIEQKTGLPMRDALIDSLNGGRIL